VTNILTSERIERSILLIRGHKVMLDADLAELYGVETRALLQAVSRNQKRFPEDFMFQMSKEEYELLRSQIVISKKGRGGRRYLPYVFTEQGVAMLSSVLRSERAVQVNIEIMRAFVRLRELVATHKDLARKLETLEKRYDAQFKIVFDAIRELMAPPTPKKRKIGVSGERKSSTVRKDIKLSFRRFGNSRNVEVPSGTKTNPFWTNRTVFSSRIIFFQNCSLLDSNPSRARLR
jgi:ORF6N domain